MATPIQIHPVIFYLFIGMMFLIVIAFIYLVLDLFRRKSQDTLIFLDKSNRWEIVFSKIGSLPFFTHKQRKYITNEGILNRKGKALFVYSEGKPNPMNIKYNDTKWLSSESLMSIINNKLVQMLVRTTDDFKDKLMLYGAIGGLIAGIASVLILVKTFGVI